jgi:hypothetical protein
LRIAERGARGGASRLRGVLRRLRLSGFASLHSSICILQ